MQASHKTEVARYRPEGSGRWDEFVSGSGNGVFLFRRGYMDYHSDRFRDHSLLFTAGGRLAAVMPAHEEGDTLCSHNGLTFGGIVSGTGMTASLMLDIFHALRGYMEEAGFRRLVYKCIPYIYHRVPSEEDLYALHRLGARLARRDAGYAIQMSSPWRIHFSRQRRRAIRRGAGQGIVIAESHDYASFLSLQSYVLRSRHGVTPVHSQRELELLASRFPKNIRLHTAMRGEELLAAALVYVHGTVAHVQYNANSDEGLRIGAGDLLFDTLIGGVYSGKEYFDFGISTESGGLVLNEGLAAYKEGYGARTVAHDFYELSL